MRDRAEKPWARQHEVMACPFWLASYSRIHTIVRQTALAHPYDDRAYPQGGICVLPILCGEYCETQASHSPGKLRMIR